MRFPPLGKAGSMDLAAVDVVKPYPSTISSVSSPWKGLHQASCHSSRDKRQQHMYV